VTVSGLAIKSTRPRPAHLTRLDYFFRALVLLSMVEFAALAYDLFTHPFATSLASDEPFLFRAISGLAFGPLTMLVAALILWRAPGNVVGGFLALYVMGFTGWQFTYASGSPGAVAPAFLIFYLYWGVIGFPAFAYLLLNFPTGHIYPPRLAQWMVAFAVIKVMGGILEILTVDPKVGFQGSQIADNPFFIPALRSLQPIVTATIGSLGLFLFVGLVAALVSLVARYRHAEGKERQQIKWVAWSASMLMTLVLIWAVPKIVFNLGFSTSSFFDLVTYAALETVPVLSIGVAILRYRLFDIDRLINRTLVYIPLTAIIAGVFAASISLSQKLLFALTGQQSDATTAFATLITVGAFEPIKTRLKDFVDKRFKEVPDPAKRLRILGDQIRSVVEVMDSDQLTRHVLDEAVRSFDAQSGALYKWSNGNIQLIRTVGEWAGDAKITAPLRNGSMIWGELALGARRNGMEYAPGDLEALQEIAEVTTRALELSGNVPDGISRPVKAAEHE
jgi:hypothetical protein